MDSLDAGTSCDSCWMGKFVYEWVTDGTLTKEEDADR